MLSVNHLSVKLNSRIILNDLNNTWNAGCFNIVIGKNGAGKSTLFKCLSGLIKPTQGIIQFDNKNLTDYSTTELAEQRIVMSQEPELFASLSVFEYILMGRHPFESTSTTHENKSIVENLLQEHQLWEKRNQDYKTLSGGEKRKVHFLRCIAQMDDNNSKERLLLLDEPVNGLDISSQFEMKELIKSQCTQTNICTIAIIHDLALALRYADHISILEMGSLVQSGSRNEVLNAIQIRKYFNVETELLKGQNGWHLVYS